ncbi:MULTISPECIES: HAD family hydrolase [Bacillus]|uniref:L-2-haloalkanoic acid dehalogenase n=2 Tax=Bacillus TaxID=1386 RepID=A0A2G6Q555_9BACI|nr:MULTISPECIES: HAD family hydrolase [Bacillus]AJI08763.1 HAD hydrolase, IA, variant 1 family protein [Bacillus cereus 03BB108]EDX59786.1 hydrolase [Bacillus cereus 03BB108]PIE91968.1 L-2-haloalkanoic acid dehalogenase [Bacillus fungorum]QKG99235.1 HAD family hydrolase [Bacillus cereus]
MIKAIIFDLDGTLLDRDSSLKFFIKEQYKRYINKLKHIPEEQYVSRFIELDNRGYVWKDKVYHQLLHEHSISDLTWEQLLEDYINNFQHHCVPFSNMEHVLKELKDKGMLLGMITNGLTEFQLLNIRALGIEKYMDTILVSEQEGIKKPQAEIFMRALERLGVTPEESVYIGDHPENDVIGARNAGMNAIWKKDAFWGTPFTDEYIIEDLKELPLLIDTIRKN